MKFKTGDKVRVKIYSDRPMQWSDDMMDFMDKIVTIGSAVINDHNWPYRIKEAPRWVWREKDFIQIITNKNDPNYAFMCKRRGNGI